MKTKSDRHGRYTNKKKEKEKEKKKKMKMRDKKENIQPLAGSSVFVGTHVKHSHIE